jgi:hypothetical protein
MCQPSWFRSQWGQVKTSSAALSAVQRQQEKSAKVGTDRIAALAVFRLHLVTPAATRGGKWKSDDSQGKISCLSKKTLIGNHWWVA